MSATASRIIKNTGWLYVKIAVNMFITLFTTRLILQGLGASDYGIFNIVGGSITMLGFLNSTMSNVTQRFINHSEGEGDKEKQKKIFNIAIVLHLIISIVVGIVLTVAGFFFFDGILNIPVERIEAAIIIYASLVLSTMFTVMTSPYEALINAHENMKYFALVGIFENLLKLLIAYCCVWTTHDKLIVYGMLMAIIPFITLSIMRVYCHKKYEECVFAPRHYFNLPFFKEMTGFAGWNFLSASTSLISSQGMSIILNSYFGVLLNAAQGIANQVGGSLIIFSSNALKAINPVLTKSEGAGDRERLHYITYIGSRIPTMILGAFSIPVLYIVPDLLRIWLTSIPEWAILFTRLMILRNLVELPFRSLGTAIYAQGQIRSFSIINSLFNIAPLILLIVCFSLGAPAYSLYIVWIVCCILGGGNLLFFCHKLTGLSISKFIFDILVPLMWISIASALPYLTIIFFGYELSIFSKFLIAILSFVIYIFLSAKFLLSEKERNTILSLIRNKIKH